MTKSKLWLLLKVQMRSMFFGSRGNDEVQAPSTQEQPGKARKRPRRRTRSGGFTIVISLIIVVGIFSMLMTGIAFTLHNIGLDSLTLLIGMVGASLFCLVTTIYQTNGFLFAFKDYELTMSLPFRTTTIVACRVIILYLWNLAFCAAVMGPAGVIYFSFAAPPWYFWPVYIVALLLTPLIPSVIATIIGTLIALAASRFERKGIMGIVFTIVFMLAYMMLVLNMDTIVDQIAVIGPQMSQMMTRVWPPAQWFIDACCSFSMGALALFAAVSIGVFWAFCVVVGRLFVRINSALTQTRTKANFKMTQQRASGPRRALLIKEFRRLFGSSAYFMNTCIGYILVPIFAVLIACVGPDATAAFMDFTDEAGDFAIRIGPVIASFLSMFIGAATTTAVSISIEGDTFWISKTIPVSSWDILRAKQNMNLIFVLFVSLVMGVCLSIAFPSGIVDCVSYFLLPLSFGVFMTMFGQSVGLKHADLEWTNETKLVKQGKAVTICTLSGMGIGLAMFFVTMAASAALPEMPPVQFLIESALFLVLGAFIYRRLKTRGVAQFDALSYD